MLDVDTGVDEDCFVVVVAFGEGVVVPLELEGGVNGGRGPTVVVCGMADCPW